MRYGRLMLLESSRLMRRVQAAKEELADVTVQLQEQRVLHRLSQQRHEEMLVQSQEQQESMAREKARFDKTIAYYREEYETLLFAFTAEEQNHSRTTEELGRVMCEKEEADKSWRYVAVGFASERPLVGPCLRLNSTVISSSVFKTTFPAKYIASWIKTENCKRD